ncbi:Dipeptidase [Trichoderma simmonsii]|uniref:Dipeptidase n=1 Tax=Trichoderma simmonsii TaxID=1491479 RepID=A0A8G0PIN6_9HYPO|nr:Dipeptidase [Trichoderma simmonsii]
MSETTILLDDAGCTRDSSRIKRPAVSIYHVLLAVACFLGSMSLVFHYYALAKLGQPTAEDILRLAPLIDGHNDFAIWIRAFYQNHIYQQNFSGEIPLYGQVDFPRLRRGGLRGQFWSVYVECPRTPNDHSDEAYFEIVRDTLQQIDLVQRLVNAYADRLVLADSSADFWREFSQSSRISSFLGVEGLHQIANSASVLRLYHRLGVRYATLTHECHNAYADSATPRIPLHHGLSKAGEELVQEMNRLGMAVDLAHVSHETMRNVLAVSTAPVIFSHSSAYAVCPHERNVPNDVLHLLRENRGIIMITFYPEYSRCGDSDLASLGDIADHIQYVGELIGYRYIGLGSDFDGMPAGPQGLEDVSKYPDLISELLHRGVSRDDLAGVIGENILRVMEEIERVAADSSDQLPLEDDVKPFF